MTIAILIAMGATITGLWIDPLGLFTEKAAGLKPERWSLIGIGSTKNEVLEILGEPFVKQIIPWRESITEQWYYSRKNQVCLLFRDYRVLFSNNMVVAKIAWISEDCKVSKLRTSCTSDTIGGKEMTHKNEWQANHRR